MASLHLFSDGWKTQSCGLWQSVGATLTLIILPPEEGKDKALRNCAAEKTRPLFCVFQFNKKLRPMQLKLIVLCGREPSKFKKSVNLQKWLFCDTPAPHNCF